MAALTLPAACGGRIDTVDPTTPEHDDSTYPEPALGRKPGDAATPPYDAGIPPEDAAFPFDAEVSDATIEDVAVLDASVPDAPVDPGECTTIEGPPDGMPNCSYMLTLAHPSACALSGYGEPSVCTAICGNGVSFCQRVGDQVQCEAGCIGRKPAGLVPTFATGATVLGRYFADAARLEAASVDAFRVLRRELAAYRAPKRLLRATSRAARDEVAHARATRSIARRFGGRAARADVVRGAVRSIEAIALENAVEGCVRETFGALTATYQAERAADPVIVAAMKKIAKDETRHAELSWEIARWIEPRLSKDARARIKRAQREAIAQLETAFAATLPEALAREAGLPSPAHAMRMIGELRATLWAA